MRTRFILFALFTLADDGSDSASASVGRSSTNRSEGRAEG